MDFFQYLTSQQPSILCPSPSQLDIDNEGDMFAYYLKEDNIKDPDAIIKRMQYVREYCLQQPCYDGEDFFISEEPIRHCRTRDLRINRCNLSEDEFYSYPKLQETIIELGLCPEATFEFILYLWFHLSYWAKNGISERVGDRIGRALEMIETNPTKDITFDISVGGKHFKFSNKLFIETILKFIGQSNMVVNDITEIIYPQKRELEYLLIATLLRHLPIKLSKPKKGAYSQTERNFGLWVRWLIGGINHKKGDDPTDYCTYVNNGQFDSLMKYYKNTPIPHIGPNF